MDKADEFPIYRAAFCGLLAMLVGLGIARFGYSPLVPALVTRHWFSASTAFWLGTANLLGYFIGAGGMRSWQSRIYTKFTISGLMGLTTICLLASSWNGDVVYFGIWRLLSGITGGALMVLMANAVMGQAPVAKRGKAGGITFAGMGMGITLTGLLIPKLLTFGLPMTWVMLGIFSLLATLIVAIMMPDSVIQPAPRSVDEKTLTKPVILLFTGYALCALGFVPHMLFLANFVATGLHRGIAAGAGLAAVLGIAAACGPPILGRLADRFGFLATLSTGYVVMAGAVALPLFTGNIFALAVSAFGVGAVALGAVMLTSGALAGMVAAPRLAAAWGLATMIYAIMQTLVAAGFSTLFYLTGSYRLLFMIGAIAALISAGLVTLSRFYNRQAATDSIAG